MSALQEAQAVAKQQGAVAWVLRAAMSLARLHAVHGQTKAALATLVPVLARFAEGLATADLVAARRLLADLQR